MELERLSPFVENIRREVRFLRIHNQLLDKAHKKQKGINTTLKEEIKRLEREKKRLEKENEKLEREIEKYSKTMNRYQVALFDHGNFQSPKNNDGEKKKKGGQLGHTNTNREQNENLEDYTHKRVFACVCMTCGKRLPRVNATQQKILLDIILNPQVVKLIIESERQWCGKCRKEVSAADKSSLPFTEYGINTFMMALLLRYRCLLPLSKISCVFEIGYGLQISKSGLVSLFEQASIYLGEKYQELKKNVRGGKIMYEDETGWQVRGKNAWMWIMANENATVYVAAESRGKGVASEMYGASNAYSMHDGYAGYTNTIPHDKQLYCWAHMLRFSYEETVNQSSNSQSIKIRDALVEIYHLKKNSQYREDLKLLEQEARARINQLLLQKTEDPASRNILHRLECQHDGLIRALTISPNGTNNFAEQELRPIALMRKTTFGSNTYRGMEITAVLASIVQTTTRTKQSSFFPTLASSLRQGFAKS